MTVHHQLKGSIRRHTWVQASNVTEQGLATINQDVTINMLSNISYFTRPTKNSIGQIAFMVKIWNQTIDNELLSGFLNIVKLTKILRFGRDIILQVNCQV